MKISERMKKMNAELAAADVLVGFCQHGTPTGFCYDIKGMKRDVKDFASSKNYRRVERMKSQEARAIGVRLCAECATPGSAALTLFSSTEVSA